MSDSLAMGTGDEVHAAVLESNVVQRDPYADRFVMMERPENVVKVER